MKNKNLNKSIASYNDTIQKSRKEYAGILGLIIDGVRTVNHPTRNGYVYVRLRDNLSEVVLAFNERVSPVYNFPVKIARNGSKWEVVGRDFDRYENWGTSAPFLPKHADQHSFDRSGGGGGDSVAIFPDQFMPLLVYPSGTMGSDGLRIAPYVMKTDTEFLYIGGVHTENLIQHKPLDDQAIMGLVCVDRTTGDPVTLIASGTPFIGDVTGTASVVPYLPYPDSNQEPLYAFRLVSGTTSLTWDNLYNVRQFIGGGGGGSTPSGTYVYSSQTADRVVISDASGVVSTSADLRYEDSKKAVFLGGVTPFDSVVTNSIILSKDAGAPSILGWAYGNSVSATGGMFFDGGFRADGSLASPTNVKNNMGLYRAIGRGYDGTAWGNTQAQMLLRAAGDWGTSSHPTKIEFYTTPSGSTTQVLAASIKEDGILYNGAGVAYTAGGITGSGVNGQVAIWNGATALTAGNLIPPANLLTLVAGAPYTLTIPATGTAGLLAVANAWTAANTITVATTTATGLLLKTTDNNTTKNLYEARTSADVLKFAVSALGNVMIGGTFWPSGGTNTPLTIGNIPTASSQPATIVASRVSGDYQGIHAGLFTLTNNTNNNTMTITDDFPAAFLAAVGFGPSVNSIANTAAFKTSGNMSAISLTNFYSGFIGQIVVSSGTLTNQYGLYLDDFTSASTLNVAIRTGKGLINLGDKLTVTGWQDVNQLKVTGFTTQTLPVGYIIDNTSTTNTVRNVLQLETQSTGTAAAGLGAGLLFSLETATASTMQSAGRVYASWVTATNATRAAKLSLSAFDTSERLGIEVEASGTVVKLGFFGVATVVRPTALTTQLTTLTHTAPATPDYAIQDFVDVSLAAGWAFASHDEANSVIKVIANLQTRVSELETRLQSLGLIT